MIRATRSSPVYKWFDPDHLVPTSQVVRLVNEVFLDDVRVPVSDLLGEEGRGWSYGKVLLDRERGVACAMGLRLGQYVRVVRDRARMTRVGRH